MTWWNDFEVYALNYGIFMMVDRLAFQFKDALLPPFWVEVFFLPREYYGVYIEQNIYDSYLAILTSTPSSSN